LFPLLPEFVAEGLTLTKDNVANVVRNYRKPRPVKSSPK